MKFEGNFGGGIEISQGVIRTRGDLDFISNTAINGGGLRLLNRAVVSKLNIFIKCDLFLVIL